MSRYFSLLRVGGQVVDLSHLEPFTLIFHSDRVGQALRAAVTFTNHCFSEKHGAIPHPVGDEVIWDKGAMRTFCPVRYQLSKDLPSLIRALPEKTVILAAHEATWVHTVRIESPAGPYHLFLTISRAAGDKQKWQEIDLMVESAYPETLSPPATKGTARPFVIVCGEVYLSNPQKPKKKRRR